MIDRQTFTVETGSAPFEILRACHYVKDGRESVITEEDLEQAVRNFEARRAAAEVPVDFDHSFAMGRGSKAAGWLTELFRRGTSLFARVKWTPEAEEMIGSGAYKFFSSEFSPKARDEHGEELGFAILAGALTNRPFLRGLGAVALSQQKTPDVETLIAEVEELKLRDDVDPAALAWHRDAIEAMRAENLTYNEAVDRTARKE